MPRKEDISEELRMISAVVAGISPETPYSAPEGYFDHLSGQVLSRIKQTPYTVPGDYFATFAEKLMARIKSGHVSQFDIPQFDIHAGAHDELATLSPLLSGLDKKGPFETPEGYFGELSANILSGVQAIDFVNDELVDPDEPVTLSPLMTGLQEARTYEVPVDYFEGLLQAILDRVKAPVVSQDVRFSDRDRVVSITGGARVFPIGRRKWMQVASAAVVAGLILTAGWFRFNRPVVAGAGTSTTQDVSVKLARASDQELENYLDNQSSSLSEVLAGNSPSATLDVTDADVKNILGNVSDDELQQYLEDNGSPKDLVTN